MPGLRATLRRWAHYWRYDFRDIVAPRCLPAPPGQHEVQESRPWSELPQVLRDTWASYLDTWRTKPADHEQGNNGSASKGGKQQGEEEKEQQQGGGNLYREIKDELAAVAKGGAVGVQPYVHKLAQIRGEMVKEGINAFTEGYKAGLQAESRSPDDGKGQQPAAKPTSQ